MSTGSDYELDEVDRHIIAALQVDGRATNQRIARSLKISPATVGARIRRLENVNAMRVVAVTDFAALGYQVLLAVGIEVQGRAAEEVAEELAALEEVFAVHLVTGARDIEILVALHDLDELEGLPAAGCRQDPRHPCTLGRHCRGRHQVRFRPRANRMNSTLPLLDALDRRIVDLLTVDARVSNRQIAAQLGVTEGTIRGRINRLEKGGAIRLTAVTNVAFAGSPRVVLIGIQAQHGELRAVSQKIAAMPEIGCVIVMLGRFDILAIGLFRALEDIVEVANNRILALPGVRHVETSIAVKTLKYDFRAAKITPVRRAPQRAVRPSATGRWYPWLTSPPVTSAAFTPLRIGPLTLRNRFIKSATNEGSARGGVPSKRLVSFHEAIAAGGVAMTTVAYCAVAPDGRTFTDQITLDDASVRHLRVLTDAVHRHDAAASRADHARGLLHLRAADGHARPLSASGGFNKVGIMSGQWLRQEMGRADLERVAGEFVRGARLARDAGFDAVEIHMGHGYLLSQFLRPLYNRRRDAYGGSVDRRARFPVLVLQRVLEAVGKDIAVVCKISVTDGHPRGNSAADGRTDRQGPRACRGASSGAERWSEYRVDHDDVRFLLPEGESHERWQSRSWPQRCLSSSSPSRRTSSSASSTSWRTHARRVRRPRCRSPTSAGSRACEAPSRCWRRASTPWLSGAR